MPRYYFDIHDGADIQRDVQGLECASVAAATVEAKRVLPAIAADEVPRDGDHRNYTVVVRDAAGAPLYTACLSFVGTWLN
ncbi:hypothetical protein MKK58_13915 [Methylobacterium sp. J-078]|uniref:DUF6894 family protein n=1 Tax=Methylobacterium sp. J-078 TaxID=2836657 RepID=UPI001FBAA0D5|nr:hypothetical protein [Methylobacterium sp. J-078]MCJ2045618.1 hypothetical protein [Methylobacterium sp. J-078]